MLNRIVLIIALLAASLSLYAQERTPWPYSKNYEVIDYDLPENYVPFIALAAGFGVNQSMRYSNSFENKTIKQRNQAMLTGYLSTIIVSYASNKVLRYCRTHKIFKKKKKYH